MPDTTNDIDALLVLLHDGGWKDFHRALTALLAERNKAKADFSDAWRERCEFAKRIDEAEGAIFGIVAERNALRKRVAELEAQPPASDLRERLVCAALTGVMAHPSTVGNPTYLAEIAVAHADAAIAAMRKGESDGK